MKVKKADDYQSWYIQEGDQGLLIDPWFDSALVDGKGWFLQRRKEKKTELAEIREVCISKAENSDWTYYVRVKYDFNNLKG